MTNIPSEGSRVGADLVQAFEEMAAYLLGEVEAESYEVPDDLLTPERVRAVRRKVAASTNDFERQFRAQPAPWKPTSRAAAVLTGPCKPCFASSSASLTPCVARWPDAPATPLISRRGALQAKDEHGRRFRRAPRQP